MIHDPHGDDVPPRDSELPGNRIVTRSRPILGDIIRCRSDFLAVEERFVAIVDRINGFEPKMKEKSAAGGSGLAPIGNGGAGGAPGRGGGPAPWARSAGPSRPPLRLTQPSTRSAKNGVFSSLWEVMPPWEWPTSQKARIRSGP